MSQPSSQSPSLAQMQAALPAFRFEQLLGRGGMGALFKASQFMYKAQGNGPLLSHNARWNGSITPGHGVIQGPESSTPPPNAISSD